MLFFRRNLHCLLLLFVVAVNICTAKRVLADSLDTPSLACVSFRAMTNLALSAPDTQDASRQLISTLAGITSFDGYLIDTANHDVVLIGTIYPDRPTLHLDDFADILRNVLKKESPPYCSLEPDREDLLSIRRILNRRNLGNDDDWLEKIESDLADVQRDWHAQRVIISGIPRNSHHARIMIDADYHMKRVTLGLVAILVQILPEIAFAMQQGHSHHRHMQVGGCPQAIAGQHS